ncbi:hypothetical protein [Mesorhizobium sp. M2D.F.Ca.ET.223.01.1.1]|nr:hypothetical protein [Mesorhizobium sp. M2D.F.Ca.ET.223.01.1.1]
MGVQLFMDAAALGAWTGKKAEPRDLAKSGSAANVADQFVLKDLSP